ncbi:RNA polymerase sigma-70 factor (ECF subfamily) [Leeuwenhoekiella polynyae]|uniref:RNA polymerase sigma-70 factor (ECF subfamily) n=2 Tax=Leeuwenhoekiella polynyae TaxID=1550906 RepID=A0A4Q0PG57_9FLAO|nr:RNA polymerase sigma-70 factor (ECF subfamily) [Leeuwenhoekiella polynyae]
MQLSLSVMSPKPDHTSEALLFSQLKGGSERAFTHFFERYYPAVTGFCKQFVYDEEQARSMAQEAFINLWLNRENLQKPEGIPSFLYTAAKSKCLNVLKHEKVVRNYRNVALAEKEQNLNLEVLNALDYDSLSLTELQENVSRFLEQLPEQTQIIYTMKRVAYKKNAEIATELNISIKTVEAHMTRALNHLREALSDYLPAFLIALFLD